MKPVTRGDCKNIPRPCEFVTCKHHLDGKAASCTLDVADEGEHTHEAVAEVLQVSRERVRQVESKALAKLKRWPGALREFRGHEPSGRGFAYDELPNVSDIDCERMNKQITRRHTELGWTARGRW